jgi:hypothetical protein
MMPDRLNEAFDCVEMKRRLQEKMRAERERRKGEFASYIDFIRGSLMESEWGREMLHRSKKTTDGFNGGAGSLDRAID